MHILVTGGTSFTARYLLPLLCERYPDGEIFASGNEAERNVPAAIHYLQADLGVSTEARRVVEISGPEVIFHVAGVAGSDSARCYRVNLEGTRNLLEAAADLPKAPKILYVSSAAVYGMTPPEDSPVTEAAPLKPVSGYGASKAAAELAAMTFHYQKGMPIAVARPFNLLGAGLPRGLAPADFLEQAKHIRKGHAEPVLRVGNLDSERDFVDIRDAVRAYVSIVESDRGWGKAFNVASGIPVAIDGILTGILSAMDLDVEIIRNPNLKQRVEVLRQTGDASALRDLTGWNPEFGLEESLRFMVDADTYGCPSGS